MILHFFEDLFKILSQYSLEFQKSGNTIIGKESMITKLKTTIEEWQILDSPLMDEYLRTIRCTGMTPFDAKCNIDQYEIDNGLKWQQNSIE